MEDKLELPESSLSIDESIEHYFKHVLTKMSSLDNKDKFNRKINFSIMKQFLFTAYNNFREMDATFEDKEFKEVKNQFLGAIALKGDIEKRIFHAMEVLFDIVFLRKQIAYMQMKIDCENLKTELENFRGELGSLTSQMEEAKAQMKKYKPGSDSFKQYESDWKRLNGKHVDKVHKIREGTDKVVELDEKMEEFKSEYYDGFCSVFKDKTEEIKKDIDSALDILAYRFDKQIWRRAKRSKQIREYYQQSGIRGLFSSKTYLEYFVGNLDEKSAGTTNKKIIKYLSEFNKENKTMVAVVFQNREIGDRIGTIAKELDSSIAYEYFPTAANLASKYKNTYFPVVIVGAFELRGAIIYASQLQKVLNEDYKDLSMVLYHPASFTTRDFIKAAEVGYRYFIPDSSGKEKIKSIMLEAF